MVTLPGMVSLVLVLTISVLSASGERLYQDPNWHQSQYKDKTCLRYFQFRRLLKGSYFVYATKQTTPKAASTGFMTTTMKPDKIPVQCKPEFHYVDNFCVKYAYSEDVYECPDGFQRSLGKCVIYAYPSCPVDYRQDGKYCILTGNTVVVSRKDLEEQTCPPGYELNGNVCYETCRSGYNKYYSNLCISKDILCPPGFQQIGKDRCLLEKCPKNLLAVRNNCEEGCPAGFTRTEDRCVSSDSKCPSNYEKKGDDCELKSCPAGQLMLSDAGCVDKDFLQCPRGFTFEHSVCKSCASGEAGSCKEYKYACPKGWRFISNDKCVLICPSGTAAFSLYCITLKLTGCPEGFLHVPGQGCIRGTECPKHLDRVDNECVAKTTAECERYTLNGKCIDTCPAGFVEHERHCIQVSSDKCPSGFNQLAGTYCVKTCPEGYSTVAGLCIAKPYCSHNQFNYLGKCVDSCPTGFKGDKDTKACDVNTNFCKNATDVLHNDGCVPQEKCLANKGIVDSKFKICLDTNPCKTGFYYFGIYCLKECPVNYEAYIGTCKKKTSSSCTQGVFYENKCVSQCPDGFVPKMGVCVKSTKVDVKSDCGINMEAVACSNKEKCTKKCECKENFIPRVGKNYCIPKEPKCPSNHSLDIVFVIDGSDNVEEYNFNLIKLFILESLTHIYSAKTDIRVGLVIFGPSRAHIMYLYVFEKECDIIQHFTSIQIVGGSQTNLIHGLRVARELVLIQCNGARIGVARQLYIVSMSSKFTEEEQKDLAEEIDLHKGAGHRMAVISVGKMTGLPANIYNLNVENIAQLSRYAYKLAEIACNDYVCPSGYRREGENCVDDDECLTKPCHENAKCYNEPGTFKCYCTKGLNYIDDKIGCSNKTGSCTDIKDKNVCDVIQCTGNANCSSSNGMGYCVCPRGFVYKADVGCIDHNECSLSPCLDNATCVNTHGSFDCKCPKGYQYNKHFGCVDINECIVMKDPCSGNGECRNTLGSYECTCRRGYEYVKDIGCQDIDECKIPKLCKGDNVQCENTNGSFRCLCLKGFEYGAEGCKDIDECVLLGEKACGKGAKCHNTAPGYECLCDKGFNYDNKTGECKIDETKDVKQRRADMAFVVDAGDQMREALFPSVKEMIKNIINDYRNNSASVKQLYFGMELGGGGDGFKTVYTRANGQGASDKTDDMTHLGGQTSFLTGIKEARRLLTEQGQTNSTKMIFFVTATKLPADAKLISEIKEQVDKVKAEGRLIIIHIGHDHKKTDWRPIFTDEEIEKYVIVVAEAFIKTVHSLIYQKSDTLISCPEGFIFLDNICQYKTHNTKYCQFDDNLYAINSTWKSECALMQCTEEGVKVIKTECMGYDGDCYEAGTFFPCSKEGQLNWQCRCQVASYMEKSTGQYQQKIKYTIISFNREEFINETKTEDGASCEFPFKYYGKWYYACTSERATVRWCSHYHQYDNRYYSYCKRTVVQQCVVSGKVYQEGEKWQHGCNDVLCTSGQLSITVQCESADGKCVPQMSEDYPCVVNDKRYSKCICLADSYGYGKNSVVSGSFEGTNTNHTSETVTFCEQRTTGKRHKEGSEWMQDCFKLKCSDGSTQILDKKCMAGDSSCHAVGTSGFGCTIKGHERSNCTCEMDGDNLALVAYTQGKRVSQETKGSVIISGSFYKSTKRTSGLLDEV